MKFQLLIQFDGDLHHRWIAITLENQSLAGINPDDWKSQGFRRAYAPLQRTRGDLRDVTSVADGSAELLELTAASKWLVERDGRSVPVTTPTFWQ